MYTKINEYLNITTTNPLFIKGDSKSVLKAIPKDSIDCIITSPPYFRKRQYLAGVIGMKKSYQEYIENLLIIIKEIYRILKPTGSFWLNIGDSYQDQQLLNLPYRIAIRMKEEQNGILRNTIIWDKVKGAMTQSSTCLITTFIY